MAREAILEGYKVISMHYTFNQKRIIRRHKSYTNDIKYTIKHEAFEGQTFNTQMEACGAYQIYIKDAEQGESCKAVFDDLMNGHERLEIKTLEKKSLWERIKGWFK